MELTFRTAGIGDLELLTESRLRAIRTYRHLSETAALPHGLPDAVRDYYRQALASGSHIALLALAGERLAATGGLDLRREMPSYHNPAGLSGHIMNIWTDPAFRGRGIAWRMLDLLTAAACERGCLTVSLHTTAMGRPLYQRYGFTATDDEMELELPAENLNHKEESRMKIGVYGGTFNPPHLGHVTAARAVFELLKLDLLLLVPDREPPHKALPAGSPTPEQRLEMTRLAGEQLGLGDRVQVLDLELKRTGRSYTSDTLAQLKERYPEDELWLLVGTDMFLTIQTWHEAEKILSLAGIAAFGRTEADTEELFSVQRDYLYRTYPQARIFTLTIPGVVDVSSTDLRTMLAKGEGVNLLPPAVYGYILREGLYGTRADLKRLPLRELRPIALSYLKNKRIPHVLGTEQEAIRLAERYGADVEKARVAALLHDCTKKLNMEEQLELCGRYGIQLDELEQKALKLLHAKTGAAIARDVFGADDEIYNAIWWHTTGHAHMTLLEKVIYLADYIEPSRNFPGVDKLRAVCYKDLDEGLLMGLEMTIEEMTEMGDPVHHATIEARDALKG